MLKRWFRDSETLLFARLQYWIGIVWTALLVADLGPVFDVFGLGKWFPVWLVVSGVVTEIARKARDPEMRG